MEETAVRMVAVDSVVPSPDNPRANAGDVSELAASIQAVGIIEPLIVRSTGDDTFVLIAGERRLTAAKSVGLAEVPVIVREAITLGPRLRHYLRAIVEEGEARLTGPQGSGILTSMTRANALLIVPADMATVVAGTTLAALLLDDPQHVAQPPY